MKVSTFIERPVLSAVISITIMVAGIIVTLGILVPPFQGFLTGSSFHLIRPTLAA